MLIWRQWWWQWYFRCFVRDNVEKSIISMFTVLLSLLFSFSRTRQKFFAFSFFFFGNLNYANCSLPDIEPMMMKNFLCLCDDAAYIYPCSQQQSAWICSISLFSPFFINFFLHTFSSPLYVCEHQTHFLTIHDRINPSQTKKKKQREIWDFLLPKKWKHSFASINIYDVLHSIASSTWNIPDNTSVSCRGRKCKHTAEQREFKFEFFITSPPHRCDLRVFPLFSAYNRVQSL